MKILQIVAAQPDGYQGYPMVFGLGEDNLMYKWDEHENKWQPFVK